MSGEDGALARGLFAPITTTDALAELTSGRAWVRAMLDAEVALATAEERVGVIPAGSATAIAGAADTLEVDPDDLGRRARLGGNPAIPLVAELRARVDGPAAEWVHWGATSQDVLDTAAMLVVKRASAQIGTDLLASCAACAALSERHRMTLMTGRTLLQHALPITFGLKAAGWLAAATEVRKALEHLRARLPVQLGGAAGTLASLGGEGFEVLEAMAGELGLAVPTMPWHTNRVIVAECASVLGTLAGVGAKIARDVALMMQTEVGEAFEPAAPGRGGSSTLPHKRNPVGASAVSTAHRRASALVAVVIGAMDDEHERGVGGWQAEWETLTTLLCLAGGVASQVRETLEGLEIDSEAMAANLARTGGVLLSERVVLELAPALGRTEATGAVQRAASRASASATTFAEELRADPTIAAHLGPDDVARLLDPAGYLGSASAFIDRALGAHREG